MPKRGGSGSRDVTSDNDYRIVDKALSNTVQQRNGNKSSSSSEGVNKGDDGVGGTRRLPHKVSSSREKGTYAHLVVTSGEESDAESDADAEGLEKTPPAYDGAKEDPLHLKSGNFDDTHDDLLESIRNVFASFQKSLELQSVILMVRAVVMVDDTKRWQP
jgi:hypothetical protein